MLEVAEPLNSQEVQLFDMDEDKRNGIKSNQFNIVLPNSKWVDDEIARKGLIPFQIKPHTTHPFNMTPILIHQWE